MPDQRLRTIFEDGLQQFKSKLTSEQQDDFNATTFKDFEAAMSVVQERQRVDGNMRSMIRLKSFLDAVQAYSSSIDIFSNVHEIVAFIWGPMKFLLLMARTTVEAFDSLLDAYEKMAKYMPLLGDYGIHLETDVRGERFLEMVFQDIFEFHHQALELFKKSSWKQLFRTNWNRFQTNFQRLLSNLENNNNLVHKQADLREFANSAQERQEAAERFRTQQAEELLRRRIYLQSWLPAADIDSDHDRHVSARRGQPQSGRWLFSRREFSEWFRSTNTASSFLWIHGIPGAGKTVLGSVIIEEAKLQPSSNVFYFYFRHGDEQRNSFISLARCLLQQAIQCEESIVTHLFETATKSTQTSLTSKRKATELLDFCLDLLPGYYILDGLDECPEEEQETIVHWFDKFMARSAQPKEHSRCLFLSQNDKTTRRLLCKRPALRITQGDNYADIQAYCGTKAAHVGLKFCLSDSKILELANKTSLNAEGMFLFARLVMDHLYYQETEEDLLDQTRDSNFPVGLDEAYARVLQRVLGGHATYKRRTKRLLSWLTCAVRPLKWQEIQTAMSIDVNSQTVDVDRRKLVEDAKSLCGSLIEEGTNGEVVLVHTTAKFYLQDTRHQHSINLAEANYDMASLCVDYLNFPIFQSDLQTEDLDMSILKGDPGFVDYSIISWTQHVENTLLSHSSLTSPLSELEESLAVFFECHWREPTSNAAAEIFPLECVQKLKDEDVRFKCEKSILAWRAMCSKHDADSRTHAPNDLFKVLDRIRRMTEELADDTSLMPKLQQYYGTKLYKCARVYCRWFHEGFNSARHLEYHKQKHERSHYCPEGGCYRATLGFVSKADLDKHIKDYHKFGPSDDDFPEFDQGKTKQTQLAGQKRPGDNICHICHKTFSKPSNLQTHLKIHSKDRVRFACSTCGKEFVRQTDLARHVSTHFRGKTFVCGGNLPSGESWGCGKTFDRRDGLNRHFNSAKGQNCFMPLANAKIGVQGRTDETESPTNQAAVGTSASLSVNQDSQSSTLLSSSAASSLLVNERRKTLVSTEGCTHETQHDGVCADCGSIDVLVSPETSASESLEEYGLGHPDTMAIEIDEDMEFDDGRPVGIKFHPEATSDVDVGMEGGDIEDYHDHNPEAADRNDGSFEPFLRFDGRPKLLSHDPLQRFLGRPWQKPL